MKTIIYLLIVLGIAILAASCEARSGNYKSTIDSTKLYWGTNRVRVVENNTITYVVLSRTQAEYLKLGDTIWLNVADHYVDDLSSNTMKAVILKR